MIIPIITFTAYVVYIALRYGVQKSISKSYYCHENKLLWWIFVISFVFPMMIYGSYLEVEMGKFPLMFFAGSFIGFISASPHFKGTKLEYLVHMIGSYGGIGIGGISLWVSFGMWELTVALALVALLLKVAKTKNHTWWIEVSAFVIIMTGLLNF